MGLFEKSVDKQEFDGFKSEIKNKLEALQKQIELKTSDSEHSAKESAEKAKEYELATKQKEESITEILKIIDTYKNIIEAELTETKSKNAALEQKNQELIELIEQNQGQLQELSTIANSASQILTSTNETYTKVQETLNATQQLQPLLTKIEEDAKSSQEKNSNIDKILNQAMRRKADIDESYNEIFGYTITGSDGQEEEIEGIKDRLEQSVDEIETKLGKLSEAIKEIKDQVLQEHRDKTQKIECEFEELYNNTKSQISTTTEELRALMPGGLAAGLSAAYETKKDEEAKSLKKFEDNFLYSIVSLALISTIPIGVNIYLLTIKEMEIIQIIKDAPALVIATLPMYLPALWFAYSANKKTNLSKRLIEEYTHKSVLGKTFSGLSNQIETLPHESAVKEELRNQLLFNVLHVSSENPGKLITDYNKSDHPLMDALEKSSKLSESVEKLSKIPGFTALAQKLSNRNLAKLQAQDSKIKDGFSVNEDLEDQAQKP